MRKRWWSWRLEPCARSAIRHDEVEYEERGEAVPNPRTLTGKFRKLVREFQLQGMDVQALLNQTLEAHA